MKCRPYTIHRINSHLLRFQSNVGKQSSQQFDCSSINLGPVTSSRVKIHLCSQIPFQTPLVRSTTVTEYYTSMDVATLFRQMCSYVNELWPTGNRFNAPDNRPKRVTGRRRRWCLADRTPARSQLADPAPAAILTFLRTCTQRRTPARSRGPTPER